MAFDSYRDEPVLDTCREAHGGAPGGALRADRLVLTSRTRQCTRAMQRAGELVLEQLATELCRRTRRARSRPTGATLS